jgi:hypothetical protein
MVRMYQHLCMRGAILAFILGLLAFPAPAGPGAKAASPTLPAACSLTFPSSHNAHVLSVSSGAGVILSLSGGGNNFTLARYTNFNSYVKQALGITPPPGDVVAPFAFSVPGGHSYTGLTNVVQQGSQDQICLHGVVYRDLGNGSNADRVPPVAVTLTGTISATYARIDLYAGAAHYFVYGHPSLSGGAPTPACPAAYICDATLGVALPVPAGWSMAHPGRYAPGTLTLVKDPTGNPVESLSISVLGITGGGNDAAAARIAAQGVTDELAIPVTQQPYSVGGLPCILLLGMPGQQPTVQLIVAHQGMLYAILVLGRPLLQSDERQILAGLYFTERQGAVPPPPGGALVAVDRNPCLSSAPVPPSGSSTASPRLTVRATGGLAAGFIWAALSGTGFRGGTTAHLRLCWSGLPRYATYEDLGRVRVSATGTFVVWRPIPLSSYPRDVYTVAAQATGAAGSTLAAASTRFWPFGPGIPARASMRLLPATLKPGQRFTVLVSGAHPKEVLDFVAQPDFATGGFGGGIMGRYQASRAGIIRFTYPAPSGSGSAGIWVITAQRRGFNTTNVAAFATLTVAR